MTADVSSLVRLMNRNRGGESDGEKATAPITRDLLGGSFKDDGSQELDLDVEVPSGWEKCLDLKSGRVYLQRCNSPNASSSSSSDHKHQPNQTVPKVQDLNFPPSSTKPLSNLLDENCLELKLVSQPSSLSSSSWNYQSVCTLDKVKVALEKAEKEPIKKRSFVWKSPSSPSYSSSSSSMRDVQEEDDDKLSLSPVAVGCPTCLLYVLISKSNPKCPRCNAVVPLPSTKRPRIDLNMSI